MEIKGSPETKGQLLYIQNCQTCHTSQLTGQPPAVPSLVDIVSRVGAERIRSVVTHGASPMPSFPDLSGDDLDSLIAYLNNPGAARVPPDIVAYLSASSLAPAPVAQDGSDAVKYWSGYGFMTSKDGLAAVKPPWSTLTAYDMNQGTIKWQIPLGGVSELEAQGIKDTGGFFPQGGPVVTAGGLIFSGTESDFKIRAYDKDTGKVLWDHELPAAPHAEVAVYEAGGREYVVLAALPKPLGSRYRPVSESEQQAQGYYVFALPKPDETGPRSDRPAK
jgi:quinoprotein glucose dehydrogenase